LYRGCLGSGATPLYDAVAAYQLRQMEFSRGRAAWWEACIHQDLGRSLDSAHAISASLHSGCGVPQYHVGCNQSPWRMACDTWPTPGCYVGCFHPPLAGHRPFYEAFFEFWDEPTPSGSGGSGVATTDSHAKPQLPPWDGSSTLRPVSTSSFVGAKPVIGANPQSA